MKFFPQNAEGVLTSVLMAENALLSKFTVSCPSRLFGKDPIENAKITVKSCMNLTSFPCAQMTNVQTQYMHDFAGKTLTLTPAVRYMSTEKEVNDLRCIASDIAENLKKDLPKDINTLDVLRIYQNWLSRFFVYKNTGDTRDHTAVGLLKTRQGVCQAVSALSMVILPHLNIPARYVSGEGYSGSDWGAHAWNAVFVNDTWQHIDFTFGLHRRMTPNTFTISRETRFRETHRWDEALFNSALFRNIETRENALQNASIHLFPAAPNKAEIGGVTVLSPQPLFTNHGVRLMILLNLLGGGCEILDSTLHIIFKDKSYHIPLDAPPQNGFIPLEVLQNPISPFAVSTANHTVILKHI